MRNVKIVASCLLCIAALWAAPAENGGVGMRFYEVQDGGFVIHYPFGGSPAARAGILTGDRFIRVDGKPIKGLTIADVANQWIRGPVGTKVRLTVVRGDARESLDFVMIREQLVFPESLYPVRTAKGWGYIDRAGNMFIPPMYEYAEPFSDGLAVVHGGGRVGYIDRTGASAEGLRFDVAFSFSDGFGVVGLGDTSYLVGRDGKLVNPKGLPMRISRFSEGRACVGVGPERERRYGFVDSTGRLVIDTIYPYADDFAEGLAAVRDPVSGKVGYLNRDGRWAVKSRFEKGRGFACGRARVEAGGKEWFMDRKGRTVFECRGRHIGYLFSEGLVWMEEKERYGYLDTLGHVVIGPRFDDAGSFADGRAWVKVGKLYGYIDRQGNVVIQPQFAWAGGDDFHDGLAQVRYKGKYQYIDKSGKVIWCEP